jgi:hypothetical protein
MPYRKITLSDGTETPVRKISWRDAAMNVPENIISDARHALSGSDGGKWTVFTVTTNGGLKVHLSNGKEVLEQK